MSDRARTLPFYMVPKALAARPDLAGSDKLVWAIIRDRIGNNATAWPGIRRLAKDAGLDPKTVLDCIGRLERAGLLTVTRPGNGLSNRYTVGEIGALEKPERSENRNVGAPKTGTEALRILPLNYTDPLNETTPNPLTGGDGENASPSQKTADPAGDVATLARIEAAYREVFASALPGNWRRRIRRGLVNGDGPWLAQVDPKAMRAGRTLAAKADRPFGLGWIRQHLEQQAARRQHVAQGERTRATADAGRQKAEEQDRARIAADKKRAAELLDGLADADLDALKARVVAVAPKGIIRDSFSKADPRTHRILRAGMVKLLDNEPARVGLA